MGTHPIKIELALGWHLLSSDYKHKFCSCLLLLFFFTRSNVSLFSQAQIASPETKLVECQQDGCCQGDVSDWAHLFVSMCSSSLPVLEMTCALACSQCRMHVDLWGSKKTVWNHGTSDNISHAVQRVRAGDLSVSICLDTFCCDEDYWCSWNLSSLILLLCASVENPRYWEKQERKVCRTAAHIMCCCCSSLCLREALLQQHRLWIFSHPVYLKW